MSSDDILDTVKTALANVADCYGDEYAQGMRVLATYGRDWLRLLVIDVERLRALAADLAALRQRHAEELKAASGRYADVHAIAVEKDRLWSEACNELTDLRQRFEARDWLLRQLEKDGRVWIDAKDAHNARLRLVYASESEVAQMRQRHAAACESLKSFIDWHGGVHDEECPADDTCACLGKPINDKANAVMAAWLASSDKAALCCAAKGDER